MLLMLIQLFIRNTNKSSIIYMHISAQTQFLLSKVFVIGINYGFICICNKDIKTTRKFNQLAVNIRRYAHSD